MNKHWLITFQLRKYGRENWIVANCATSKSPAQWLHDARADFDGFETVLLFVIEITDDERQLIEDSI